MYTVIFTTSKIDKHDAVSGVPEIMVYHSPIKKLAMDYLIKRSEERINFMLDRDKTKGKYEFEDCGSKGDGTWTVLEYIELDRVNEPGYHHTREEYILMKSNEIIVSASTRKPVIDK